MITIIYDYLLGDGPVIVSQPGEGQISRVF